jgi:hypothetical protein
VTDINIEACFGSPSMNDWYILDLNSPMNKSNYYVVLPNDDKKPIWKRLPPGTNDCSEFEII